MKSITRDENATQNYLSKTKSASKKSTTREPNIFSRQCRSALFYTCFVCLFVRFLVSHFARLYSEFVFSLSLVLGQIYFISYVTTVATNILLLLHSYICVCVSMFTPFLLLRLFCTVHKCFSHMIVLCMCISFSLSVFFSRLRRV